MKNTTKMVVCKHCPTFPHPLDDDGTPCINPREVVYDDNGGYTYSVGFMENKEAKQTDKER